MYIELVPNRTSRPALLLREAWREGQTVRKRTLANLTDWPAAKVEAFRRLLRGEAGIAPEAVFAIERSVPHGYVAAILGIVRRLGLESLLAAKRCRARDLVLALLVERLLHPCSKLATTLLWDTTMLADELGVQAATEDEVYTAMDWFGRPAGADRAEAGGPPPRRGGPRVLRREQQRLRGADLSPGAVRP